MCLSVLHDFLAQALDLSLVPLTLRPVMLRQQEPIFPLRVGKAAFSPDTSCRARTAGPFAVARWRRTQLVEKVSMLGFNRWHLLKGLAAILCIAGIVSLALIYFIPAPPSKIAMPTSVIKGTTYDYYAQRYRERFARANVKLEFRESPGSVETLGLLQDAVSGVR
jgi:hypothetical protein